MRYTTRVSALLLTGLVLCASAQGKDNPSLAALRNGINEDVDPPAHPVSVSTMKVNVRVHGHLADVTLEARLTNPSDETDEARFALSLPPDAIVTGYALDVDGRMIDGYLLDQPKARNVYEDEVRAGIDPGLAELTDENLFQTRVYPVTKDQPRTIRVSFAVPFGTSQGFVLPLQTAQYVKEMAVQVSINGYRAAPRVRIGGRSIVLKANGDGFSATDIARDFSPRGELTIVGGQQANALLVSRHHRGKAFFQISDSGVAKVPTLAVGRLRVYWDRSLSRRDDLLDEEKRLLSAYVEAVHPEHIDLVTFASDTPAVRSLTTTQALRDALDQVVYRGGTRMAALENLKLGSADQCLLFSDGLLTVDGNVDFQPGCRLSIITSAREASGLRLGGLAQRSMGQLLRLTADNAAQSLSQLLKPVVTVVAAYDDFGHRLDFRALPSESGGWFAVGEMPEIGGVRLTIAGLRKGLTERTYRVEAPRMVDCDAPAAVWASQRVAQLAEEPLAHDQMATLARQYQVASPTMAFLVMERPDQYLRAHIRPPAGFSQEWMEEYRQSKREREVSEAESRAERLKYVLGEWNKRKEWWSERFTPLSREQVLGDRRAAQRDAEAAGAARSRGGGGGIYPSGDGNELQEIMVTGTRVRTDVQDSPMAIAALLTTDEAGKTIELDVADVLAEQPYIKALDAASVEQRQTVLAAQEKIFGSLPAFYLETSEWFRLKGDVQTAESLLYSALELAVTDDETRQIVAFRLQRAGQLDRAVGMLERIAVTSSFRPQPKRALALALAERGRAKGAAGREDLERAFALLTAVALEPAVGDFDGIETIALMEANALIPAIDAAGGSWSLDRRLVGLLDTDLRIVIEWTADDADVDLWVIEPNGEKVYYAKQISSSGGAITNDMTDGYGPEEYVIHRAPSGEYQVRINGYDADRLNPNGKGRVMVRMIRDFGRPKSRETFVDADLDFEKGSDRNANGGTLIAKLKVEDSSGKALAQR